jgi:spore coat protein U-like protein
MSHRPNVALVAALVSIATDSLAATATGTMPISAGIGTTCTVASSGFSLGSYPNTSAVINQQVGAFVTCSNGLPYTIDLDGGQSPTSDKTFRQFSNVNGNRFTYNIYKDSSHTQVWGSTMVGGSAAGFTGTGAQVFLPAFLQIPVQTTPPSGIYNDTITITATF